MSRLEATQQLSFVFAQTEGEDFLFHTPPAIDPRSGDLTFCLAGGASGNANARINENAGSKMANMLDDNFHKFYIDHDS